MTILHLYFQRKQINSENLLDSVTYGKDTNIRKTKGSQVWGSEMM
jgi:hypothetical protein